MEEWRDVPGYDGIFQINIDTPQGRCRHVFKHIIKEKKTKPTPRDGRIIWQLTRNYKQTTKQAAVWIVLTYPELVQNEWFPGAEIDHIDTDRLNNHPSNLRWVTSKENSNNPLTLKHSSEAQIGKQINNKRSKEIVQIKDNIVICSFPSIMEAERQTGINHSGIIACLKNRRPMASGCIWKYKKEV